MTTNLTHERHQASRGQMDGKPLIQIVIAEEDPAIVRAVTESLDREADMEVVGAADRWQDAADLVFRLRPDVLLLNSTSTGGVQALRQIKERAPDTKVLILTFHPADDFVFSALQMGAKGCLLKDSTLDELTIAVREVASGVATLPPAVTARVLSELEKLSSQRPAIQSLFSLLTRKEVEVLRLIGLSYTNRQIAAQLHIELTTVKKHITSIRQKLDTGSRAEVALVAHSSGLTECQLVAGKPLPARRGF